MSGNFCFSFVFGYGKYAYEVETKQKEKLPDIKKKLHQIMSWYSGTKTLNTWSVGANRVNMLKL